MSQLKLNGTAVELNEFQFGIGFVETNSELIAMMYARVDNAPDEVTRAYQSIVTMHASVVNLLAKNALAHAVVGNGVPAANVEAELVRVLFQTIETHRKQLDECEAGNPPAMPAKPDAAALSEAISALQERHKSVVWKIEFSTEPARAASARLLLASVESLLQAAANGLIEPSIELSDEDVAARVASDTQRLIDSGQFNAETAAAKIKEIYGETPEAHKAFLLDLIKTQLGIGSEGVAVANVLTTAEQIPLVGQALDAIEAILAGTDDSAAATVTENVTNATSAPDAAAEVNVAADVPADSTGTPAEK